MLTHAIEPSFSSILTPDAETAKRLAVISRAKQLAEGFKQITINSPGSYVVAGETLKAVKSLRGEVETACRPEIDLRFKAHKEALKEFKEGDGPLEIIENSLKRAILTWDQEQERVRRAEQERLQRIADEEAKKQAEEAKLQAAIDAEEAGDKEGAQAILDAPAVPVMAAPVVLATTTPKVEGLTKRQIWKCDVTDLAALVKAVAAGTVPLAAIQANTVFLGQQARSLKAEMKYPGIRVWPEDSLAGRG